MMHGSSAYKLTYIAFEVESISVEVPANPRDQRNVFV